MKFDGDADSGADAAASVAGFDVFMIFQGLSAHQSLQQDVTPIMPHWQGKAPEALFAVKT
jgi:hypothetical protein